MFGDQTWCMKAMRDRDGIIALSFGIEERDLYSEYMSRVYQDRLWLRLEARQLAKCGPSK